MKFSKFDKIKKYIKLICAYPNYKTIFIKLKKNNSKRAIYIGSPIHTNLGDHLITIESLKYLEKFNFNEIIEIPEFVYEIFRDKIDIKDSDIVFISGGGWMGNLYEDELVIEDIISRWKKNSIIIFPQTVFFNNGTYSSMNQLKKILSDNKNVILTVREENSYMLAINKLKISKERCFLLPDMALLGLENIRYNNKIKRNNTIIFSIRNDVEMNNDEKDLIKIIKTLKKNNIKTKFSSSVIKTKIIFLNFREKILNRKIKEFSGVDLIITDRLHSMVFSLLAGTKCIAIDNSTHKVTGVYQKWLKDIPGLIVLNSISELSFDLIKSMLQSQDYPVNKNFNKYFEKLNELIGETIHENE